MPQPAIDADQAVQEILNTWGANRTSLEPHPLNADFSALFDKMQAYRTAKGIADNRRAQHKREFVAAYGTFMRQK
jgi:methionine synthase I (cobalamin-dependent)